MQGLMTPLKQYSLPPCGGGLGRGGGYRYLSPAPCLSPVEGEGTPGLGRGDARVDDTFETILPPPVRGRVGERGGVPVSIPPSLSLSRRGRGDARIREGGCKG